MSQPYTLLLLRATTGCLYFLSQTATTLLTIDLRRSVLNYVFLILSRRARVSYRGLGVGQGPGRDAQCISLTAAFNRYMATEKIIHKENSLISRCTAEFIRDL